MQSAHTQANIQKSTLKHEQLLYPRHQYPSNNQHIHTLYTVPSSIVYLNILLKIFFDELLNDNAECIITHCDCCTIAHVPPKIKPESASL